MTAGVHIQPKPRLVPGKPATPPPQSWIDEESSLFIESFWPARGAGVPGCKTDRAAASTSSMVRPLLLRTAQSGRSGPIVRPMATSASFSMAPTARTNIVVEEGPAK